MAACGGGSGTEEQQIDREAIREEMEQREIKRILPAELVEEAYQRGEEIAMQAQDIAVQAYQQQAATTESGQSLITEEARLRIDSLAKAESIDINWVGTETPVNSLGGKEQQLWEAYLYNVENGLPLEHNVQRIGEEEYLYTKPLSLDPELRKKLPGSEDQESTSGFLGMWSIQISKKALIQSI